jgi:periplasmic divalent cation tolerance protein
MSQPIAVVTTVGSQAEAQTMARSLVERGLAACAQIEAIESFYRWKGAVQHDAEFRVTFKTIESQYPVVEAAIRALHSYELPAIHAVALAHVHAPYAQWVCDNANGT